MSKNVKKYHRCKKCKELVNNVENCANCRERNALSASGMRNIITGKRGRPTLDIQEGNREEYFGDND